MKKILFIHPFLPYPLESGGHQALFNGILAVKDDMDITLVYEAIDDEKHKLARQAFSHRMPNVKLIPLLHQPVLSVPTIEERIRGKIRSAYRRVFRIKEVKSPVRDSALWWKSTITPMSPKWIEHIYKVSHEQHYDIIQIEMPWRIPDIYAMPRDSKIVFVHHELGFVRRELEMKGAKDNYYLEVCKKFVDANEIMQLKLYDAVVTLSSCDKQKLLDMGVSAPVYSSFVTIDIPECPTQYGGNGKRLVFVGPETHKPNYSGIIWFLENCWNKLREFDPNYTLEIVGNWSPFRKEELSKKYVNVKFLGYVDNLNYVIKNSIMIVPITIGSGIRIKILEACTNGVPFVSTTIGAEGLPVKNGEHCFLADTPDKFVEYIIKLQDSSLCETLCQNAYNMIKHNYSMGALRNNRLSIYESLFIPKMR